MVVVVVIIITVIIRVIHVLFRQNFKNISPYPSTVLNHTLTLNIIISLTLSLILTLTLNLTLIWNLTLILTLKFKTGWVQADVLPRILVHGTEWK